MAWAPYWAAGWRAAAGAAPRRAGAAGDRPVRGLSQGPTSGKGRPSPLMNRTEQKAAMPRASGTEARQAGVAAGPGGGQDHHHQDRREAQPAQGEAERPAGADDQGERRATARAEGALLRRLRQARTAITAPSADHQHR